MTRFLLVNINCDCIHYKYSDSTCFYCYCINVSSKYAPAWGLPRRSKKYSRVIQYIIMLQNMQVLGPNFMPECWIWFSAEFTYEIETSSVCIMSIVVYLNSVSLDLSAASNSAIEKPLFGTKRWRKSINFLSSGSCSPCMLDGAFRLASFQCGCTGSSISRSAQECQHKKKKRILAKWEFTVAVLLQYYSTRREHMVSEETFGSNWFSSHRITVKQILYHALLVYLHIYCRAVCLIL